jgi:Zn-dependent peptidase ImmA (M78 family)/transcriptional regulator with XRE-family HTH domain
MGNKNLIDINPKILVWAREEIGVEADDISSTLKVDSSAYTRWEKSGEEIPFTMLKVLAKILKRQVSCFFLPDIPKKTKKPKDHRNLKVCSAKLSPDTLLSIRRANRYKNLLLELNDSGYYIKKYTWIKDFNKFFSKSYSLTTESAAKWVRKKIGFSIDDQLKSRNVYEAYKLWRIHIEQNLGVPVLQFKMPREEIQGFSYSEEAPYCIVVNNNQAAPTSKVFTLIHELAHILKHQSSLCYPEKIEETQKLEFECNTFAGNLLIPASVIKPSLSSETIYKEARKLKVSSEAYLRRLKHLNLINNNNFFGLLEEIRFKVTPSQRSFVPHLTQLQKSINSRGKHLFDTVVEAAKYRKISYSNAAEVLGIKINYFMKL